MIVFFFLVCFRNEFMEECFVWVMWLGFNII